MPSFLYQIPTSGPKRGVRSMVIPIAILPNAHTHTPLHHVTQKRMFIPVLPTVNTGCVGAHGVGAREISRNRLVEVGRLRQTGRERLRFRRRRLCCVPRNTCPRWYFLASPEKQRSVRRHPYRCVLEGSVVGDICDIWCTTR